MKQNRLRFIVLLGIGGIVSVITIAHYNTGFFEYMGIAFASYFVCLAFNTG